MPPYVLKLIKNYDDKANALASGLAIRPLTSAEILAHLEDFGIDSTLAHGKVGPTRTPGCTHAGLHARRAARTPGCTHTGLHARRDVSPRARGARGDAALGVQVANLCRLW